MLRGLLANFDVDEIALQLQEIRGRRQTRHGCGPRRDR